MIGHEGEGDLWTSVFVTSGDGLSLHNRDYTCAEANALPVVCLPGLARTAADFHELAAHLARHPQRPRRVIAMSYRGRGRSDRDPDWRNYDVRIELQDVQDVLTALGIEEAVFVGTSRGAIITMALSTVRPRVVRGAVLNDFGPIIDGRGLARIRTYVGRLPKPRDWVEAVALVRKVAGAQFTRLNDLEWERFTRRTFKESPEGMVADYDPALLKGLEAIDLDKPLPVLWQYFEGLAHVPILSIRGENSDLLSAETQAEMVARHSACQAVVSIGEGHAPLLGDQAMLNRITAFVMMAEHRPRRTETPEPRAALAAG
jgi:pimeloyl-ACP methyl ester carboxylesterase